MVFLSLNYHSCLLKVAVVFVVEVVRPILLVIADAFLTVLSGVVIISLSKAATATTTQEIRLDALEDASVCACALGKQNHEGYRGSRA